MTKSETMLARVQIYRFIKHDISRLDWTEFISRSDAVATVWGLPHLRGPQRYEQSSFMKTLNMWTCWSSSKLAARLVDQPLTDHTARVSWSSPREKSHHVHTTQRTQHTHVLRKRKRLCRGPSQVCQFLCPRPPVHPVAPDGRRTVCGFVPEESGRKEKSLVRVARLLRNAAAGVVVKTVGELFACRYFAERNEK